MISVLLIYMGEVLKWLLLCVVCRVPWFHYPIIYDIRSRPHQISSPTGSKGNHVQSIAFFVCLQLGLTFQRDYFAIMVIVVIIIITIVVSLFLVWATITY